MTQGFLDSDLIATDRLSLVPGETCLPAGKPPHIIMLLDESSFDITAAPGIKVPEGYQRHFRLFDGKTRSSLVEASGGPTWFSSGAAACSTPAPVELRRVGSIGC